MKKYLPLLSSERKPGLTFRAPASAVARWDQSISAAAKQSDGEIAIMGEIGPTEYGYIGAEGIKRALDAIGKAPVNVLLNSPGGDAFEGIAIYNLLRAHPGKITVKVLGMAASAASVIAMAGDEIIMAQASTMMIHSAWALVIGNQDDMREFADVLDMLDTSVAGLYASRTGLSQAEVLRMMKKETWMSAELAVEKGFADVAQAEKKAKSSLVTTPTMRAALGDSRCVVRLSVTTPPGASGNPLNLPKGTEMKPIAEQIASFEAKRMASAARMTDIMSKAGDEGRSLEEAEKQEYETLKAEVGTIDEHIVRLKDHEQLMLSRAKPVVNDDEPATPAARPHSGIISVKSNLEPGIPFTRYVKALAVSKGSLAGALAYAQANQRWKDQTPEVEKVLMAAVAAGDTTTAGWAAELVYNENLASAFLEFLRPQTIIGKIQGMTRVPFNVRWGSQTAGSSGYWVGEGKPIPVSKLTFGSGSLGIAKAAGLVVLTKELIMSSSPNAEVLVRNDLAASIAQFLDQQFIAPDYAAVANVSPASITNGVAPTAATGTTSAFLRADVQTLFGTWIAANVDPSTAVWIMTPTTALAISLMLNALGQPVFPGITMNGGTFMGLPVIVSNSAKQVGSPVAGEGNLLVLVNAKDIAMADEGGLTIDASSEASIEMKDDPTNASKTPTTATSMVSMFQTDSVALRAIRFINWVKRRSTAVVYVKDAAYVS